MSRAILPASSSTRGSVRALGAVTVSLLSIPLGLSFAGGNAFGLATSVPPPPTKTLPAELDFAPKYQEGYRCLSGNLPGPVAFAKLLNSHYGTHVYGINRTCAAEHGEGRALDWMVNANTADGLALGNAITRWLSAPDAQGRPGAMARRFGINDLIWNRQMWRAYDPGRGWAPYSGVSPHTDHIHTSFTWDGAYQQTSWWTGTALTAVRFTGPTSGATLPTPVVSQPPLTASGYPLLKRGDTHKDVMLAQGVLGLAKDGQFGPTTETTLASWQSRQGVAVTKQLDDATWTRMILLGLVPARNDSTSPLSAFVNTVVQRGSRGSAVVALQKALNITADGSFGPGTETKVKTFQSSKSISPTGIVAKSTWLALMGQPVPVTPPPVTPPPVTPPPPPAPVEPPPVPEPAPLVTSGTLITQFTKYKGTALKEGDRGTAVKVLQAGLGGVAVDGVFGTSTTTAVKALQIRWGLAGSGVVELRTWNRLELSVYPLYPWWPSVAKLGSTGPKVVALQRALRITADGSFGAATQAAVKEAQARAKLTQTGVVASLTWKAIENQM